MNSRLVQAILHGLKVGAHILVAIVFVGALTYLDHNQSIFVAYLVSFGVPTAVTNMVFAAILKYLQMHQPTNVTIDSPSDLE